MTTTKTTTRVIRLAYRRADKLTLDSGAGLPN
jgi:hypothetical protein